MIQSQLQMMMEAMAFDPLPLQQPAHKGNQIKTSIYQAAQSTLFYFSIDINNRDATCIVPQSTLQSEYLTRSSIAANFK